MQQDVEFVFKTYSNEASSSLEITLTAVQVPPYVKMSPRSHGECLDTSYGLTSGHLQPTDRQYVT